MKVDGGTKQQRRHERQNGRRDEKGNKAIRGRCCLAGPSPPSVPTEMGERVCWPPRMSPSLLCQQQPLLFRRILLSPKGQGSRSCSAAEGPHPPEVLHRACLAAHNPSATRPSPCQPRCFPFHRRFSSDPW